MDEPARVCVCGGACKLLLTNNQLKKIAQQQVNLPGGWMNLLVCVGGGGACKLPLCSGDEAVLPAQQSVAPPPSVAPPHPVHPMPRDVPCMPLTLQHMPCMPLTLQHMPRMPLTLQHMPRMPLTLQHMPRMPLALQHMCCGWLVRGMRK